MQFFNLAVLQDLWLPEEVYENGGELEETQLGKQEQLKLLGFWITKPCQEVRKH